MAKTTAPLLSFGASGTVAKTVVYSKWKGRQYSRRHVVPSNPQTAEQDLTRNTFGWLQAVYKIAPALVTDAWDAYARGQVMTGRNAFIKKNLPILRPAGGAAAGTLDNFIVSPGAYGGLLPLTITPTPGNDQMAVAATAPAALPQGWTVRGVSFAVVPEQDPDSAVDYEIQAEEDLTAAYTVTFTGLQDATEYQCFAWVTYNRPTAALPTLSPSRRRAPPRNAMKLDPSSRLSYAQVVKQRGRVYPRESRGQVIVQAWPKKRGQKKTVVQDAWVSYFSCVASVMKHPEPKQWDFATANKQDSRWFVRDFFFAAAAGNLIATAGETKITTPTVSVYRSSTETLTANVVKTLTPNTLEWDNNQFWNSAVNPSRITFKSPGLYLVEASCEFVGATAAFKYLYLFRNNEAGFIASDGGYASASGTSRYSTFRLMYFHANDYIEVRAVAASAGWTAKMSVVAVAITPEAIL